MRIVFALFLLFSVSLEALCQEDVLRGSPFTWNLKIQKLKPLHLRDSTEASFWLRNDSPDTVSIFEIKAKGEGVRKVILSQRRLKPQEVAYVTVMIKPENKGRHEVVLDIITSYHGFKDQLKIYFNVY